MTSRTIVTLPDPVLHAPTAKVGVFDDALKTLTEEMREAMHLAKGVGLAAPQIGQSLKLAVIEYDPKRFRENEDETGTIPFFVIANPKITFASKPTETLEEGCLSVPELGMPVTRATEVHVLAQNLTGERFRIRAKGFLARILQHEIDHLNQFLIVDRTSDPKIRRQFHHDK